MPHGWKSHVAAHLLLYSMEASHWDASIEYRQHMFLLKYKKANNLSEQHLHLRQCTVSFNGLLCHRKCWDWVGRLISLPAIDITLPVLSITLPLPNIDTGSTFIGRDGKLVSLPEMNFTLPFKTLCHTHTGSACCTWSGRLVSSSKMDFILPLEQSLGLRWILFSLQNGLLA